MKQKLLALALALAALPAFSCWFQKISYNDHLNGVNNFELHSEASSEVITPSGKRLTKTEFTAYNNQTVDLPLTVSLKLISDSPVYVDDETKKPELLKGKLQYRILPDGEWTTVAQIEKPTGTITLDSQPDTYFGKNNIMPLNLKAGDVIMVRVYLTDGIWQSGDLESKCNMNQDWSLFNQGKAKTWTLPTQLGPYEVQDYAPIPQGMSLGGGWLPHYVVTVVFSGNYRPIR